MHWEDHSIWWQVYPLGFLGAPIRGGEPKRRRTLAELVDWLPYLVDLGTNGLLLGPIFSSATHGYDTLDYYKIDPRLGDQADWDALVGACRAQGVRICLDGVFNHVSSTHPWVLERPDWITSSVFEGHQGLVELNHSSQELAEYVAKVMHYWLARGADAWRLDAAYATETGFWAKVLPTVRTTHPEAWIFGEVIHGDYPRFVSESGVDSVTQYRLWKAIWSSLRDANFFELEWALREHNDFLGAFTPQTFIGNHDVTRIATQVAGADKAILALAVLLSVGGVPSIYYGDEQGFTATKQERAGGDDDIRPEFPARPQELSQLGGWIYTAHQRLIGMRRRHGLTRAQTETLELTNETFSYRALGESEVVVELDLRSAPKARITSSNGIEFSFGQ